MKTKSTTIIAVSSTIGEGLRGVIRISGAEAFEITSKFVKNTFSPQKHRWKKCSLMVSDWNMTVPAIFYLMKAPFSYTSEHVVEIHTYSSPTLLDILMKQFIIAGCKPAEPGEFTKRAFLSGKMDLTQAEAVAEIIAAKTENERKSAFFGMTGRLSQKIYEIQEHVLKVVALMEAHIDFSDEEIDPLPRDYVLQSIYPVCDLLGRFHQKNKEVSLSGVRLCICGAPNAGKSTLFNALLNKQQALVSDISGTTLDWVEDFIVLDDIRFNLIDTPGVEEQAQSIQQKAQQKGKDILEHCDIAILVIDSSISYQDIYNQFFEATKNVPLAILYNKIDLPSKVDDKKLQNYQIFRCSLIKSTNLTSLKSWLVEQAFMLNTNKDEILLNTRQHYVVDKTRNILQQVINDIDNNVSYEFIVGDLRLCLDYLGEVVGRVTTEDILGEIFSKFCIGK